MAKSKLIVPDGNVVNFVEPYEAKKLFGRFNKACVIGKVVEEFKYSHEYGGIKYYKTLIESKRASGVADRVPIIISGEELNKVSQESFVGKFIEIAGRYRSYRVKGENDKLHLELALLVASIKFVDGDEKEDTNVVYLEGTIGKDTLVKESPHGRIITDFFIVVPKSYKKSDFIPCIAWEQIGLFVNKLAPGTKIKIWGRIQSRKYLKRCSETSEMIEKEAYEVSVWRLKKLP